MPRSPKTESSSRNRNSNAVPRLYLGDGPGEAVFGRADVDGGSAQRTGLGLGLQCCNRLTDADKTEIRGTALNLVGNACGLRGIVGAHFLPQVVE